MRSRASSASAVCARGKNFALSPSVIRTRGTPSLFLEIANASGQMIYLSATAFQPTFGVATYQDVTLPAGEPVIGDPPSILRNIALPNIEKS